MNEFVAFGILYIPCQKHKDQVYAKNIVQPTRHTKEREH